MQHGAAPRHRGCGEPPDAGWTDLQHSAIIANIARQQPCPRPDGDSAAQPTSKQARPCPVHGRRRWRRRKRYESARQSSPSTPARRRLAAVAAAAAAADQAIQRSPAAAEQLRAANGVGDRAERPAAQQTSAAATSGSGEPVAPVKRSQPQRPPSSSRFGREKVLRPRRGRLHN